MSNKEKSVAAEIVVAETAEVALPSFLQAHLASLATTPSSLSVAGDDAGLLIPRLSSANKNFSAVVNGNKVFLGSAVEAVIIEVDEVDRKQFYEGEYTSGATLPPTCASTNGVLPTSWTKDQINNTCAGCPMDQWKSAKGGKSAGKACAERRNLIVWIARHPQVEALGALCLSIPATSLKPLKAYLAVNKSAGVMFTKISFDPAKQHQYIFEPVMVDEKGTPKYVNDAEYALAQEYAKSPEVLSCVNRKTDRLAALKELTANTRPAKDTDWMGDDAEEEF
jgi:hypothetical protein